MSFRAYMILHPNSVRRIETVESNAKREVKLISGSDYWPIEIPSNKSELIGWINDLLSSTKVPGFTEPAALDVAALMDDATPDLEVLVGDAKPWSRINRGPTIPHIHTEAPPANPVERRIMLEEAIQGADGFELSILIGNVMSRLEELKREAGLTA